MADGESTSESEAVSFTVVLTVRVEAATSVAEGDTVTETVRISVFVAVNRRQFRPPYPFGHTH